MMLRGSHTIVTAVRVVSGIGVVCNNSNITLCTQFQKIENYFPTYPPFSSTFSVYIKAAILLIWFLASASLGKTLFGAIGRREKKKKRKEKITKYQETYPTRLHSIDYHFGRLDIRVK